MSDSTLIPMKFEAPPFRAEKFTQHIPLSRLRKALDLLPEYPEFMGPDRRSYEMRLPCLVGQDVRWLVAIWADGEWLIDLCP